MNKIETIFDRGDDFRVIDKPRAGTEWVFAGEGMATEKIDGTNIRITVSGGKAVEVEKRRNPDREEKARGEEPGYVSAHRDDPSDKHIFRAVDGTDVQTLSDGIYPCEAIGPKIQGNPLNLLFPRCYMFTVSPILVPNVLRTYNGLRELFANFDSIYSPGNKTEGIVFHHPDGRMAKIKVKDFPKG